MNWLPWSLLIELEFRINVVSQNEAKAFKTNHTLCLARKTGLPELAPLAVKRSTGFEPNHIWYSESSWLDNICSSGNCTWNLIGITPKIVKSKQYFAVFSKDSSYLRSAMIWWCLTYKDVKFPTLEWKNSSCSLHSSGDEKSREVGLDL